MEFMKYIGVERKKVKGRGRYKIKEEKKRNLQNIGKGKKEERKLYENLIEYRQGRN